MMSREFVSAVYCVANNKVLLIHHKKLDRWLPPGGHIDKDELPCECAVREFKEETGFDIELHEKEGKIGKQRKLIQPKHIQLENIEENHQHIDLIYFARLKDQNQSSNIKKDEINDLRWFSAQELDNDELDEAVRISGKNAINELGD